MEKIKTLLIANRGEIAVRIIRTAKTLGIKTITIYTPADTASLHVSLADQAVLLSGENSRAYTEGDEILKIAQNSNADAIIPGYGFLSENADFARKVGQAGMVWCGPSPEVIEDFGIKHIARKLAEKAGVPIVPGSKGLVETQEDAVSESERIGFPVILKATGGGGGMGLVVCNDTQEVKKGFDMVQSRGQQLFKNPGLFIERYYAASRHIEVQIFGNGQGQAIHFGERECSIQRRHQKVIEECPSPFVEQHRHFDLRRKLGDHAIRLAESINYASAGTVEFLVDDNSGDYFFLETNTRLQVEHGITELCYDIDLVQLMLRQADAQLSGRGGLSSDELRGVQRAEPQGHAIEARVYAENPLRDFAPSPGLLQKVEWRLDDMRTRIDTFAFTGTTISSYYDPMIAKVMYHAESREAAIEGISRTLKGSQISGPPTNLDFLAAIVNDRQFQLGDTLTSFLKDFEFRPAAIDVISGGAYTLVQDLPGRATVGMGIPHSGAMDPVALSIANALVGNAYGEAGLEITLHGPELRFLGDAVIALTGASMPASIDDEDFPMWSRRHVKAGQRLKIGRADSGGCRAYLTVHGGLPSVARYFGSKATSPVVAIGGLQGRALAPGDVLSIITTVPEYLRNSLTVPWRLWPQYPTEWSIMCTPGPHDAGYMTPEDIEMLYSTKWKVSHNASRSAIRLIGPAPTWARKDGAEGGAHPSNVVEYGYPLYGLNWTGDDPAILTPDGPNFGGFVCSNTVISADYWKVGQLKVGDTLQFVSVTIEDALSLRKGTDEYVSRLTEGIHRGSFEGLTSLANIANVSSGCESSIIYEIAAKDTIPRIQYRQGGDQHLIACYADDTGHFDINNRVRVTALDKFVRATSAPQWLEDALFNTVGCCNTLTLYYDSTRLDRKHLLRYLIDIENDIGDLRNSKVPCRRVKLPLSFTSREQDQANKRYQETQRPYAPYLPSNFDFVARNNAFSSEELKQCYLNGDFLTVFVGFYCGLPDAIPVDPRKRFFAPKTNPSRVFTPEGTVGLGGGAIAIYPVDSPGGYQMNGRTIPCWDHYGWKEGFSPEKPWIFQDFDLISFHEVTEQELNAKLQLFRAGQYRFEWEEAEFDMAEHNRLLQESIEEVRRLRAKQAKAQDLLGIEEKETLEKCRQEKSENQLDEEAIEELLAEPGIIVVEAPMDANVWKVQVAEGERVEPLQTVSILEAMKMEVNVDAPEDLNEVTVAKILVRPGDAVKAGSRIALLRTERG